MHRNILAWTAGALLTLCAIAHASTPTIHVGDHFVGISAAEKINVYVTGGDPIAAIDMLVSIADEGNGIAAPADAGEPKIVEVDVVTGTIFDGNSYSPAPGQVLHASDQVWQIDTIVLIGTTSVPADGKIFTITLDTTGVPLGSTWALRVLHILEDTYDASSNYSNTTVIGVNFAGSNGMFTIVPEPSSVILFAFAMAGAAAFGIRRPIKR